MRFLIVGMATCALGMSMAGAATGTTSCPAEIDSAQLGLGYAQFDAAGWRTVLAAGCTDAAVAQLRAYRDVNRSHMSEDQVRELNFHMGQALAMSGREEESIPYFEQARGGDQEWSAYVEATLAFLRRDAAALQMQRDRYAAASGASEMRLSFIDGFIACPAAGYVQAVHCRMVR